MSEWRLNRRLGEGCAYVERSNRPFWSCQGEQMDTKIFSNLPLSWKWLSSRAHFEGNQLWEAHATLALVECFGNRTRVLDTGRGTVGTLLHRWDLMQEWLERLFHGQLLLIYAVIPLDPLISRKLTYHHSHH